MRSRATAASMSLGASGRSGRRFQPGIVKVLGSGRLADQSGGGGGTASQKRSAFHHSLLRGLQLRIVSNGNSENSSLLVAQDFCSGWGSKEDDQDNALCGGPSQVQNSLRPLSDQVELKSNGERHNPTLPRQQASFRCSSRGPWRRRLRTQTSRCPRSHLCRPA